MKKFILFMLSVLFSTLATFAQPMRSIYKFDTSKFSELKVYPIERVYFYSEDKVEGENVISFEGGWYMAKVDDFPEFKVRFNNECDKAIIDGGPFFQIPLTVVENENRLTLYNKKPYFGFVYDKKYKALYHFTSKKYYRRVRKHIKNYPIL